MCQNNILDAYSLRDLIDVTVILAAYIPAFDTPLWRDGSLANPNGTWATLGNIADVGVGCRDVVGQSPPSFDKQFVRDLH